MSELSSVVGYPGSVTELLGVGNPTHLGLEAL